MCPLKGLFRLAAGRRVSKRAPRLEPGPGRAGAADFARREGQVERREDPSQIGTLRQIQGLLNFFEWKRAEGLQYPVERGGPAEDDLCRAGQGPRTRVACCEEEEKRFFFERG